MAGARQGDRRGARAPGAGAPYPERLGRWPAAAALLAFTWIELASGWSEQPRTLAIAVLGYTALTLTAQAVYGVDVWTRRGEAFAVYFDLFARISRVRAPGRRSSACARRSAAFRGSIRSRERSPSSS